MPRVPYTPYPTLTSQDVPGARADIPTSPAMFGAEIGAGEEHLGAGIKEVGESLANIQNMKDEVTVNGAVTQNFKDIDVKNGDFEKLPGDQQQAGLLQHIDNMRQMVQDGSAGMSPNQKLMYDRQTLWNLRAQISRAVGSANSSYHTFTRDNLKGAIENQGDHAIGNVQNDALFHLDLQGMSEKYAKLSAMDRAPPELVQYNLRKTMDGFARKMVAATAFGPKEDVATAQRALITLHDMNLMTETGFMDLQARIDDKRNDIEAKHWSRDTTNRIAPLIGGSTTGIVTDPNTAPTEPVTPIPPAQQQQPGPEIRSEISPAQDALNRGDYLAYATELHRPHAPKVQLASLPSPMRNLPTRASGDVGDAIDDASRQYGLNPDTMRAIASIESDNSPGSNRNRATQYKGLFQIGRDEWRRYGQGDIYNPRDNAMAAARMLADHQTWFRERYGRNPSDAELYMMHQQGRGFFSRGAMTNIAGNRYPGMRGPQDRRSFQQGWANELARRKMLLAAPEQMAGA